MKNNSNLEKLKELAERLGYTTSYTNSSETDYSDYLIIRGKNYSLEVKQVHKYEPDAPYGGYIHVYYVNVKINNYAHIGMYEYNDVCELLEDCRSNINNVLNNFS